MDNSRAGAAAIGAKLPGGIGETSQYLDKRRRKMQEQLDAIAAAGGIIKRPGTQAIAAGK